jgi:hypothetical protein
MDSWSCLAGPSSILSGCRQQLAGLTAPCGSRRPHSAGWPRPPCPAPCAARSTARAGLRARSGKDSLGQHQTHCKPVAIGVH